MCMSKAKTMIHAVHVHVIELSKIVSVNSELEAYKISALGCFGTDFLDVFETNHLWECYAAEIRLELL